MPQKAEVYLALLRSRVLLESLHVERLELFAALADEKGLQYARRLVKQSQSIDEVIVRERVAMMGLSDQEVHEQFRLNVARLAITLASRQGSLESGLRKLTRWDQRKIQRGLLKSLAK